jgi:hypothetical protein
LTWLKIDDGFAEHAKIADLCDRSFRLHVVSMCYSARNLTDGRISVRALKVITAIIGASRVNRNLDELLAAGLWRETEDGWEIRDFLEYNPSAEKVKGDRARNAERQKKHRSLRDASGNALRNGVTNDAPTRPDPKEQETSIATPVDKEREEQLSDYFRYADEIGFQGSPRLEALNLGPTLMDEALRRTRSRGDITNHAAYFTTVTRNLLAVQKAWKSEMPLDDRLLVYVQNAGHEYDDATLSIELMQKGADHGLIERLLVKADEIRNEEAA